MMWICGLNMESSMCCSSQKDWVVEDAQIVELSRKNKLIEEQIARDKANNKDTMKLLLLGKFFRLPYNILRNVFL